MINYILISYATMLLLISSEVNTRECTNTTVTDAKMIAFAPLTFPIFIFASTYVATTENGTIDCNISKDSDET